MEGEAVWGGERIECESGAGLGFGVGGGEVWGFDCEQVIGDGFEGADGGIADDSSDGGGRFGDEADGGIGEAGALAKGLEGVGEGGGNFWGSGWAVALAC